MRRLSVSSVLPSPRLHERVKGIFPMIKKYMKFIGPGLMVSVAYMDPGNYSTAVAAGSAYKYKLLFSIFLSNCLAVFLQVLSAKLGAVTGLDLASNCKQNLSVRTNIIIYALAELAIIATDLAEVVGTAISLNILFNIPLVLGVLITVIDVLIVLMVYRPKGPLLFVRLFESFVSILVAATVVCFTIELYQVSHDTSIHFSISEVLCGFLPNEKVVDMSDREGGNGLFLSLAILGATVMPHSLYLGSGLVQARLKDYDIKNGFYSDPQKLSDVASNENISNASDQQPFGHGDQRLEKKEDDEDDLYRPSIHAVNDTMSYTIVELVISLFTVALFVNSVILIVAGATLNNKKDRSYLRDDDDGHNSDEDSDDDYTNADLFTINHLLTTHLSPTAGFVFALALLCSGQSAGVVCTLAGQMISEGFLSWSLPPVTRRLITRALAIMPCIIVVSITGREGLAKVLNASQVLLSLLLPAVSAPLIWFTCSKQIMRIPILERDVDEDVDVYLDSDDTLTVTNTIPVGQKRFHSSEPAIRLQDLRSSHPCSGWDEDDVYYESNGSSGEGQKPNRSSSVHGKSSEPSSESISGTNHESYNANFYRIKGFKDMSNGPFTAFFAILVWGFITCLNLYLLGSMALGFDVPL